MSIPATLSAAVLDSDGDGIPDSIEGSADPDGSTKAPLDPFFLMLVVAMAGTFSAHTKKRTGKRRLLAANSNTDHRR